MDDIWDNTTSQTLESHSRVADQGTRSGTSQWGNRGYHIRSFFHNLSFRRCNRTFPCPWSPRSLHHRIWGLECRYYPSSYHHCHDCTNSVLQGRKRSILFCFFWFFAWTLPSSLHRCFSSVLRGTTENWAIIDSAMHIRPQDSPWSCSGLQFHPHRFDWDD